MTRRHFLIQLAVAISMMVFANIGVRRMADSSVPRQTLRRSERAEPVTDLFLGNSLMAAGLDEQVFAASHPGRRALNVGLGSTGPVEHYLIYAQLNRHRDASVYYGFFDTQLTESPKGDWNTLVGNQAMAFYVDLETALRFYAPDSPVNALKMKLVSHVPMLVERYAIWAKVERIRRTLSDIGLAKKETNRFGRADDFALLEADDATEFASRCGKAAADRVPLSPPIIELFALARARGVPVYIVEMPMPAKHRDRFYETPEWKAYRAHLIALVREKGGIYVQASDWIPGNGFADHLHLNSLGAEVFSTKIGLPGEGLP